MQVYGDRLAMLRSNLSTGRAFPNTILHPATGTLSTGLAVQGLWHFAVKQSYWPCSQVWREAGREGGREGGSDRAVRSRWVEGNHSTAVGASINRFKPEQISGVTHGASERYLICSHRRVWKAGSLTWHRRVSAPHLVFICHDLLIQH